MDHSSPAQPQPVPAPASLAVPRLWNRIASDYLRDVAPGLALFAEDALRLGGVVTGCRCADVACGPGDLSLAMARAGAEVASLDFSDEMVALLRARANREGLARIEARVGDGMALPWSSASFDVACSMFGLIFFPDRAKGLGELLRVLRPGGRAVVSSWVPANRVPVLEEIWSVLGAAIPDAPYRRTVPPLGDSSEFRGELVRAGFEAVEVHEVQHALEEPSAVHYWRMLERTTPPVLALREAVSPEQWTELSAKIAERLESRFGSDPHQVPLIALLGKGVRPGA